MTTPRFVLPPIRFRRAAAVALWLVVSMALAAPMAWAQKNSEAAKFYEDALVRFNKQDLPGAIIQLKNALKLDNTQLPVHLLLGRALMQNGEVNAAEVALNEALRLGVNRAEVVALLGQAYLAQGKHNQLLEAPTLNPAGLPTAAAWQMHVLRASVYSDLGDHSIALRELEQARALDARNIDVWFAEVSVRIRARQYKEATAAYEKAMTLVAPGDTTTGLYQKAIVQHVQGDLAGALASYDRLLQVDPGHKDARIARVGIQIDLGRFADAARQVAELDPMANQDPRPAYFKALLAERDGDSAATRAALTRVTNLLDAAPFDYIRYRPQLLMLNGLAHFGLNQGEKAKRYLEAFHRVHGSSPASKLLARIYLANGDATQAVSVLESYLRASPGDGQALTLLASAHVANGRHARAAAVMEEALKAQDHPSFRAALGLSLLGDGKRRSGLLALEAAYKRDPRQTQAATALIQLYLRDRQSRKAIPVAEALMKQQPSNPSFHNLLGMARGQAGDIAAARGAFEKAVALDDGLLAARLNLARLEIANREYDAAAGRLAEIHKRHPKNTEAMHEMSRIAERRGQPLEAQRWLEMAVAAAHSKDLQWDMALFEFQLRQGRAAAALEAVKVAASKTPESVPVLLALSRAHIATGDHAAARSSLQAATRFAAFEAPPQVQIAGLQLAANDLAGAAYSLDKALSGDPDYPPALALMAELDMRQGNPAKAESRARALIAKFPRHSIGHNLLGDLAMANRQLPAAIESYRRAHDIAQSTASVSKLFHALWAQDNGRTALPLAEKWLKRHPQDFTMQKALADGFARSGNYQAAGRAYEAALKLKPKDPELLNNLSNVQLRQKDIGTAIKTAEAALTVAPGNPIVSDTLGWALYQNGETDRALQVLRDARLRMPSHPEIRYHLAVVLAKTGRSTEARAELNAALESGAQFESIAAARQLLSTLK